MIPLALSFCLSVFSAPEIPQRSEHGSRDRRIDRVLDGLRPPIAIKGKTAVRWTMAERMRDHHVPGASVAIIDGGRIVWAGAFGVKESGNNDPVSTSTLFQAQSISKAVSATAILRLAESGRLS